MSEVQISIPAKLTEKLKRVTLFKSMEVGTITHGEQIKIHEKCKEELREKGYRKRKGVFDDFTSDEKERKVRVIEKHLKKEKKKLPVMISEKVTECLESAVPHSRTTENSRRCQLESTVPLTTIDLNPVSRNSLEKYLDSIGGGVVGDTQEFELSTVDDQAKFLVKHSQFKHSVGDELKKGGKAFLKFLRGRKMDGLSPTRLKKVVERRHEYCTENRQNTAREDMETLQSLMVNSSIE